MISANLTETEARKTSTGTFRHYGAKSKRQLLPKYRPAFIVDGALQEAGAINAGELAQILWHQMSIAIDDKDNQTEYR